MKSTRSLLSLAVLFGLFVLLAFAVAPASAQEGPTLILVKKTLETEATTTWNWSLAKTASQTSLELAPGQSYDVTYTIVATPLADTTWTATGQIRVNNVSDNPAYNDPIVPQDATVVSVTDQISGVTASVDCVAELPYTIPPTGNLPGACEYTANGTGPVPTTNTATVTLDSGATYTNSGLEPGYPIATLTEIDECINVVDDNGTPGIPGDDIDFGQVCAGDPITDRTFSYTVTFVYEACGEYSRTNTVEFTTNDTETTGTATKTVNVTVPCEGGCTLTQGYWKTHSEFGPAPYDSTWAQLANGASTPFYYSGKTWYQVFWTTPQGGNAYYILAHQYMAAKLNVLNGAATTPAVVAALAGAETYFNNPANTGSPAPTGATRTQLLAWATTLDNYNNGVIGPGHCSE